MTDKRVVITGIGIYSCIGKNINEVTNSLKEGKSGIDIDANRKAMGYRSALTGVIDIPNLKGVLSRRQRVSLAEEAIYAYVSTKEALENAKIEEANNSEILTESERVLSYNISQRENLKNPNTTHCIRLILLIVLRKNIKCFVKMKLMNINPKSILGKKI